MNKETLAGISQELGQLFARQLEFLEGKKLMELSEEEVKQYDERNARIAELSDLLSKAALMV